MQAVHKLRGKKMKKSHQNIGEISRFISINNNNKKMLKFA